LQQIFQTEYYPWENQPIASEKPPSGRSKTTKGIEKKSKVKMPKKKAKLLIFKKMVPKRFLAQKR
jgi:hypothetical protein